MRFEDHVLGAGANARNSFLAVERADHDQRCDGTQPPQKPEGGMRIQLRGSGIEQNNVRSEFGNRRSECLFGIDALGYWRQAGPAQLMLDQLGVGLAVFQHQYTERFTHRGLTHRTTGQSPRNVLDPMRAHPA